MTPFVRSRRTRPNLAEAEEWLKSGHGGGMASTDYVSIAERRQRLEELAADLPAMLRRELATVRSLDLVVMKCHLLLEYMLNQFIDLIAPTEGAVDDARFTFKQKQAVVHMLGMPPDPLLLPSLDVLNTIRNQVAHTLSPDRNLIDKLIGMNVEEPREIRSLTDARRVTALKQITHAYCGMLLGMIEGRHAVDFAEAAGHGSAAEGAAGPPCCVRFTANEDQNPPSR